MSYLSNEVPGNVIDIESLRSQNAAMDSWAQLSPVVPSMMVKNPAGAWQEFMVYGILLWWAQRRKHCHLSTSD
jgi:hypothetical protein